MSVLGVSAILFCVLGIHVAVPFLAWQWSRQPFVGVLLEHTLVVNDPVEVRWAGSVAGLKNPDRVLAVNGRSVRSHRELRSAVESLSPSEGLVTLTVERVGPTGRRSLSDVQVELSAFPVQDLIARFVIPYVVALCYLGIGIWVFVRRLTLSQAQLFALFCAGASTLMATTFDMYTTHLFVRVWIASFVLTCLPLLWLMFSFFSRGVARWVGPGQTVALILALALLIWNQMALYGPDPRGYFIPWLADYVFLAASVMIFAALLIYIRLRMSNVRLRLQAQAILIGLVVAFTPTLIWVLASALGRAFSAVGQILPFQALVNYPPMIFFPLAVGYAIYRYPSLDPDLLSGPFFPSRPDLHVALRNFSRELAGSLDGDLIQKRLLSQIGETFRLRHGLILMLSRENRYELTESWGKVDRTAAQAVQLWAQDLLVEQMRRDGRCMSLPVSADGYDQLTVEGWTRLQPLHAALLVPLRAQEHLLGVLALGPLATGAPYSDDDVALLGTLADQAAIALENARLYGQQVEQGQYLIRQTRQLTDILSLGNRLKSLEREVVVQSTVEAVCQSLGFGLVTLSLVDEDNPRRVRLVAWEGVRSATWERLALTSFPLIDFEAMPGVKKLGYCYFVFAPDSEPSISTLRRRLPWAEGDQLYVPLTGNEGLLGYLTVDRPEDGLRPTEGTLEVLEIFANQAAIAIQNANLYDNIDRALDERLAELSTLQEIDRQINVKLDFQHVTNTILDWALRITSAVAGTLALVSEDGQSLRVVAHRGYPDEMERYWDTPWPVSEGIVGRAVHTGKPELVEDTVEAGSYVDGIVSVRSHLSAPIKRLDRVIGVVSLESPEPKGFTADHVAFLMRLADHATIAIENASLYDQTQLRVAELSALQQISLDLTSRLDINSVLSSISESARMLVSADRVVLYLYDSHQDALSFGTGISSKGREEQPPVPVEENQLARTVARSGEAMVIHNADGHPMINAARWQVGAIASIPLRAERVLGVFDVAFDQPHTFTSDELRVLSLLANQAAIAVKNAQLYAEVRRANEAKSEFVSIVSHELKVPMTSIQGYARLVEMGAGGPITDKQHEFVDVILNNVERMSTLVADLLDSSRIESGRIQLAPRSIALSKLIQDSINSVRAEIESREHALIVDVPEDLPNIQADPGRIMQVIVNLLSNAYKYTPKGGQIRVWARRRAETESAEGQWVVCAVTDSGIGISPQDQKRLFQQFFRIRDPQTANETGTGLGLSITRSIVELHGGRVWVESAYGQGSTFYFTLPVAS